jgi:hypothetical protein
MNYDIIAMAKKTPKIYYLYNGNMKIIFFLTKSIFITLLRQKLLKIRSGGEILEKHELDEKITEVSKSILSYCMARTSNQQDAQDLAQDIVLEIIRSSQNIRDDRAF